MKSVGEAMAFGRTFAESLQKALRSLEIGLTGLDPIEFSDIGKDAKKNIVRAELGEPTPNRIQSCTSTEAWYISRTNPSIMQN